MGAGAKAERARFAPLVEAARDVMGNEVGEPHPCAHHFEGCRVQWGNHCDCAIEPLRAALAALEGK
jgi:hypothetical protein